MAMKPLGHPKANESYGGTKWHQAARPEKTAQRTPGTAPPRNAVSTTTGRKVMNG